MENRTRVCGLEKSSIFFLKIQISKYSFVKYYGIRDTGTKNCKDIHGKPDIALTKYSIAIFCDREFFYGKKWEVLNPRLEKGNNGEYWISKMLYIENEMIFDIKKNEVKI